jgi:hypothetical protein
MGNLNRGQARKIAKQVVRDNVQRDKYEHENK